MSAYHYEVPQGVDLLRIEARARHLRARMAARLVHQAGVAVAGAARAVVGAIARWSERRALEASIDSLNPRVLEDIGLTRDELLARALGVSEAQADRPVARAARPVPIAANEDAPRLAKAA